MSSWTTLRELSAYIVTHAIGLAVAFTLFPGLIGAIRQSTGMRDMVPVAIALHSGMAVIVLVLVLFLIARRLLATSAGARA